MPPAPGSRNGGSPLDRLSAWHRLGERTFEVLRWLASGQASPPDVVRNTAQGVLRYFDLTITVHHRDEEDDLHPALVESMAGSDPVCLRELAEAATAGHRRVEAAWRALRPAFVALARGEPASLDADAVEALVASCEQCFAHEDRELLPTAQRLLDDAALALLRERFDQRHYASRGNAAAP
jgi:Hemerythrin HHE cation binding domain